MHDVAYTAVFSRDYALFILSFKSFAKLPFKFAWDMGGSRAIDFWNINCCPLIQSEPAKSIHRAVSEFILGQFLWLGWHISIVFRCMFSHPPTWSQNIWEVPVWVSQNLFFFNCILDDCSWWEAVNHPKTSNQFDLFFLFVVLLLPLQQAVHRVHPEGSSGSPGETEAGLSDWHRPQWSLYSSRWEHAHTHTHTHTHTHSHTASLMVQ